MSKDVHRAVGLLAGLTLAGAIADLYRRQRQLRRRLSITDELLDTVGADLYKLSRAVRGRPHSR